jgi:uncharacterized protein YjbJ (UPF0337 family)
MNSARVKGAIDKVVGTAKRKTGELTGDTPLQIEGIAQQVKGSLQSTWGKAKDTVQQAGRESATRPTRRGRR